MELRYIIDGINQRDRYNLCKKIANLTSKDLDYVREEVKTQDDYDFESMKNSIRFALTWQVSTAIFLKADGTKRMMECTLDPLLLPKKPEKTGNTVETPPKKKSDDVCRVFDVEAKEWRSFRWDSLIMFICNGKVIFEKKEYK